jgi:tripartite ATP-independent transporter DctM subunit
MLTITFFGLLVLLMGIGVPIAVALALTAAGVMAWTDGFPLLIMTAQRMYAATTSFPLLAIPFFILAGNLMNTGGMTVRIFRLAQLLVGRVPGGLGHVNVVASMLFAGMSGSAVADAAGLGTVEIEAMTKAGYDRTFAATITAVSSTIGPILPPSIPFVIYGSLANVSVGVLFLAGVVPGILMGVALMAVISIIALRVSLPRDNGVTNLREAVSVTLSALPAIITPLIIIGGILSGFFTPTEASVVASLYALFIGLFAFRELQVRDIYPILWETAKQTVQVMFIIAAAGAFGWVLIQQQVPNTIIAAITGLTTTPWIVLLLVNVILFVLGMFLEAIAVMIIVFPIFLPLMAQIGVSPEHFGVIMVLNLMIGLVTPPVGLCLFAVSSVSGVPVGRIVSQTWPYVVALIAVLGIVTYVPEVVMALPNLFHAGLP